MYKAHTNPLSKKNTPEKIHTEYSQRKVILSHSTKHSSNIKEIRAIPFSF
jgi:hypothetical protein